MPTARAPTIRYHGFNLAKKLGLVDNFVIMSSSSIFLFGPLLLLLVTTYADDQSAPSSGDQQVLQLVNAYRTQIVGIPALSPNAAAACVGQQIAHRFVGTSCNNETGADTPYGQTPDLPDLPTMLAACGVNIVSIAKGYVALDCVPGNVASSDYPTIAAQNITNSHIYEEKLNDTIFTSAGVGSEGVWYALVLATNSSDGNYATTNGATQRKSVREADFLCVLATVLAVLYVITE